MADPARPSNALEVDTDDDAHLLAEDLRRSVGDFVRAIRRATATERTAQAETLDLLDRRGPMNVAAIAHGRGVSHQTMRLIVASLLAEGLLRQDSDPNDRRSKLISIAPPGRAMLARGRQVRTALIGDAIAARLQPGDRAVLRQAVSLLDRLSALDADLTEAAEPSPGIRTRIQAFDKRPTDAP